MSLVALKNLLFCRSSNPSATAQKGKERRKQSTAESARTMSSPEQEDDVPFVKSKGLRNARVISDATIGLADGLTVPFALTAGLSALGDVRVVIFGGIAELIAGAISMGLGGYLGAKSELASYKETLSQTEKLVRDDPDAVALSVRSVFTPYEVPVPLLNELMKHLSASGPRQVDFVMQFHHCVQEPASSRALTSGITIAMGYLLGGLLPLVPYFGVHDHDLLLGLYISVGVMGVALFSFGYIKTCVVSGWLGSKCLRQGLIGGLQMMVVGGAAAAAAWGLVKAFHQYVE